MLNFLSLFWHQNENVEMIAKNPEVQEKLREEIQVYLPSDDSRLELNSLDKMPYLAGVIKEGLRLHPPAIGTARVLEGPVELNGYNIEKTALYFAVNSVMQTSSRYIKVLFAIFWSLERCFLL